MSDDLIFQFEDGFDRPLKAGEILIGYIRIHRPEIEKIKGMTLRWLLKASGHGTPFEHCLEKEKLSKQELLQRLGPKGVLTRVNNQARR